MTTWMDRLRPASFRSVGFKVKEIEGEIGRDTVLHKFPGQDSGYSEDLGKRIRAFTVEAFIVGPNYDQARDNLIVALETAGPATLVHPYWGEVTVATNGPVRVKESTELGGYASFSIPFARVDQSIATLVTPDTAALVKSAVGSAQVNTPLSIYIVGPGAALAVQRAFVAAFKPVLPSTPFSRLLAALNAVLGAMRLARQAIANVLGLIDNIEANIAQIEAIVQALILTPEALYAALLGLEGQILALFPVIADVATPSQIALVNGSAPGAGGAAAAVASTGGSAGTVAGALGSSSSALLQGASVPGSPYTTGPSGGALAPNPLIVPQLVAFIGNMGSFQIPASATPAAAIGTSTPTAAQAQELAADAALTFTVQALSVMCACEVAVQLPYASSDEAVSVQTALVDALDQLCQSAPDDDTYSALADLQAAIGQHLSAEAGVLPVLETFTPIRSMVALVIAHELYGDATRETEIVTRNDVSNPAMVPGGQALEVLSV